MVPDGCISDYGDGCADDRGALYQSDESETWSPIGIYELNLFTENGLGYYGNGIYGNDTVTLGVKGDGLPTLDTQVVAGIAASEFWLGALPLSPWPVNFTEMNTPLDGLMTTLKKAGRIGSLSYGYTAGANARSPQVYGSLTLGGFDKAQFEESNVTFNFGGDISRDLLIPVERIQISNNDVALSRTQYFFIDSLVPDLWLPDEACDVFEEAFGIRQDNDTGLYLVGDNLHDQLTGQNLSVTFTIGTGKDVNTGDDSDATFEITMPYFAFDLEADGPLVPNATHYFPLRRASDNTTQYTLGRAFLQAAYLIADYEHGNFSVHQARWPESGSDQDLVPILLDEDSEDSEDSEGSGAGLGGGAIAGIVIGSIAAITIIAFAGFFIWRKRRQPPADPNGFSSEMDTPSTVVPPAASNQMLRPKVAEIEGYGSSVNEAPGSGMPISEMEGRNLEPGPGPHRLHQEVHEMDSGRLGLPELETPSHGPQNT